MLLMLFVVISSAIFFVFRMVQNKQIPYIAFKYNTRRENSLYICSDGKIFVSTSEEAFMMAKEEIITKIKQNDYSDILEYVGTTKPAKVRKMYRLFSRVVLKEDYRVRRLYYAVPASAEYGGTVGYWYGVYSGGDGKLKVKTIYHSNSEEYCSDKRAYKIVDWMYECLKEYMR